MKCSFRFPLPFAYIECAHQMSSQSNRIKSIVCKSSACGVKISVSSQLAAILYRIIFQSSSCALRYTFHRHETASARVCVFGGVRSNPNASETCALFTHNIRCAVNYSTGFVQRCIHYDGNWYPIAPVGVAGWLGGVVQYSNKRIQFTPDVIVIGRSDGNWWCRAELIVIFEICCYETYFGRVFCFESAIDRINLISYTKLDWKTPDCSKCENRPSRPLIMFLIDVLAVFFCCVSPLPPFFCRPICVGCLHGAKNTCSPFLCVLCVRSCL